MSVFISSTCSSRKRIADAIEEIVGWGYYHIELSAGMSYEADVFHLLAALKEKYGLTYLIHNYFPPPKDPFVLNLASMDKTVFNRSYHLVSRALSLCMDLGINAYGVHAGFLFDLEVGELGGKAGKGHRFFNRKEALHQFAGAIEKLQNSFPAIKIYVENNCYSYANYKKYGEDAPFLLLSAADYFELKTLLDSLNLLLDIGHLKVSSNSLGRDFRAEAKTLIPQSGYLHLSDNNGSVDQNRGVGKDTELFDLLCEESLAGKTITLEIKTGNRELRSTHDLFAKRVSR
jgi:sugar phosphate isomerase/epimerase